MPGYGAMGLGRNGQRRARSPNNAGAANGEDMALRDAPPAGQAIGQARRRRSLRPVARPRLQALTKPIRVDALTRCAIRKGAVA